MWRLPRALALCARPEKCGRSRIGVSAIRSRLALQGRNAGGSEDPPLLVGGDVYVRGRLDCRERLRESNSAGVSFVACVAAPEGGVACAMCDAARPLASAGL